MQRRSFLAASAAATLGLAGRPVATLAAPRLRRDDGVLRLNSNENALGPSERARRAVIEALAESNRYTHLVAADLRQRIAEHHAVPAAAVVLGNGSAEILQMATQAVARPGGRLVVADPTFEQVYGYGEPWGLERVKVPLTGSQAHDIGRMREAARGARGPVLAYVCTPNNPTGGLTSCDEVEAWIRADEDTLFLVDEAYFEYVTDAGYRSALPLAMSRPNVVVVRTFSKIHGLAGLRLPFLIAKLVPLAPAGGVAGVVDAGRARAGVACRGGLLRRAQPAQRGPAAGLPLAARPDRGRERCVFPGPPVHRCEPAQPGVLRQRDRLAVPGRVAHAHPIEEPPAAAPHPHIGQRAQRGPGGTTWSWCRTSRAGPPTASPRGRAPSASSGRPGRWRGRRRPPRRTPRRCR